jgi:hypothetical protein
VDGTSGLMLSSARAFLAALTPEQRAKAVFPFDDEQRFVWHFTPVPRRGVPLKDLSPAQRQLAQALISSGYSIAGAAKAATIMSLEEVLLEQEKERAERSIRSMPSSRNMAVGELMLREGYADLWQHVRHPDLYFLTIFGDPSADTSWGWRLEGHHVSLNITVVDGREVVAAPTFFGANPAEVRHGPRAGLRALAAEEDLARRLLAELDGEQRSQAIVSADAPDDILTFNHRRAEHLDDAGITAAAMNPAGRESLNALLEAYAGAMPPEVAARRMAGVRTAPPEQLRFAWLGSTDRGQGHYYRIQGPSFLIEYDNTQDSGNHIHSVWRDYQGDWGLDLLGRHLEEAHAR